MAHPYPLETWTDPERKARLFGILKRKSYIEGEVTLASGKKSDFYIDCRQTSLDAEGATLIGELFYAWIAELPFKPVAVGGMTLGADPLGTATSIEAFRHGEAIHAFIIRKEAKDHGMKRQIEGTAGVKPGDTVVLLEDVVTTGGSSLNAVDACEAYGLKVGAVFCMVDRLEGGAEALAARGLDLLPLFTRKDFKG